jgi:hypothetical protein
MTGKEKLKLAVNHEEGPVLFDIGGMPTTGIHCKVVERLREYYGLEKRPVKILEPVQMLGFVEDDLKNAMGIQTTPLCRRINLKNGRHLGDKRFWLQRALLQLPITTEKSLFMPVEM